MGAALDAPYFSTFSHERRNAKKTYSMTWSTRSVRDSNPAPGANGLRLSFLDVTEETKSAGEFKPPSMLSPAGQRPDARFARPERCLFIVSQTVP